MTLPALLAPGNLPSLSAMFEVDVVIVTETKLFDLIRNRRLDLQSPRRLRRCADESTLSHRSFLDLSAKVTDTFLLFLKPISSSPMDPIVALANLCSRAIG
jgi:hypothetical protein